jgi:hypothetical protein
MRGWTRILYFLAMSLCVGLAGCGGTSESATIVSFAGHSISRSTLEHWIPIESIISRDLFPQQPPPAGVVPDPPRYKACITYEKATAAKAGGQSPSAEQLARECRERYEQVRRHMLHLLIAYQWTAQEAQTEGVKVSEQELQQTYASDKREDFGTEAAFHKYLRATGETVADELKITLFNIETNKIFKKVISEHGASGLSAFYHGLGRRLAAETSCSPGYVIPDCEQYKGSEAPEI